MTEIIKNYIGQIQIGAEQSYKNLSVFPVLSDYVIPFAYLTLDEALSKNLIEVVEIDEGGSVPELRVINNSEIMVLILDGEELVGAKQNRIVNTTILIPAQETVVIPVSCVEEGRWSYDTERFHSEERIMSPTIRAMKTLQVNYSVRESGNFRSDQSAIWDEISAKASRREAESDSMAMAEIYKKEKLAIDDYLKNFAMVDSQIGAIFLINGKVVGMDCFGKSGTFEKTFKKILESYALDAIDWYNSKVGSKRSKIKVNSFLKTANDAQVETHPSVGLGTDCRLDSNKCTGFALSYEDQVFHLSVFAREAENKKPRQYLLPNQTRPSGVKHLPSFGHKNPGKEIVKPTQKIHLNHGYTLHFL
jgi:hypothetical protein